MQMYGRTDTGRVRSSNQDAYVCAELTAGVLFAVVCDGMGGASGGNVASAIAVKVVSDRILELYRDDMSNEAVRTLLSDAVALANTTIFDAAMADLTLRGMGTTIVVLLMREHLLHLVHVGDSRAYLLHEQELEQLTTDHSVVQALVEQGQLTETEAQHHPRKHMITRALGVDAAVESDFTSAAITTGDLVLLCTDGLSNMVESADLCDLLLVGGDDIADRLIAAANMKGGSDNITAVVLG